MARPKRISRDRILGPDATATALAARPPAPTPPAAGPITELLYARLTADDLAEIEAALEGPPAEMWAAATPEERRYQALLFAAWYRIPGALEHTGLIAEMPPEDIHAMARGPFAAGGDPGIADAVVAALERSGFPLPEGGTILDFGSSSGRVLRAIAAARPDLECLGCDPNGDAIAWANEHLPLARFFQSPVHPPLELADASVDAAYAISIWSHFGPNAAVRWLDEMHRVIRPGGALVITTHGLQTLARGLETGFLSPSTASTLARGMLRDGLVFVDVFGEQGDWGVTDPEWGNAYLTLDWLAERATPDWAITLLEVGRIDRNQDAIVLERRG